MSDSVRVRSMLVSSCFSAIAEKTVWLDMKTVYRRSISTADKIIAQCKLYSVMQPTHLVTRSCQRALLSLTWFHTRAFARVFLRYGNIKAVIFNVIPVRHALYSILGKSELVVSLSASLHFAAVYNYPATAIRLDLPVSHSLYQQSVTHLCGNVFSSQETSHFGNHYAHCHYYERLIGF